MAKVRFLGALKTSLGVPEIEVSLGGKAKLRDVFKKVRELLPKASQFLEESGDVKPGYLVFVNGYDMNLFEGVDTEVDDGSEIVVIPVAHGG